MLLLYCPLLWSSIDMKLIAYLWGVGNWKQKKAVEWTINLACLFAYECECISSSRDTLLAIDCCCCCCSGKATWTMDNQTNEYTKPFAHSLNVHLYYVNMDLNSPIDTMHAELNQTALAHQRNNYTTQQMNQFFSHKKFENKRIQFAIEWKKIGRKRLM